MNPLDIEMVRRQIDGRSETVSFYYAALGDLREKHQVNADIQMPAAATIRVPLLIETLRLVESRELRLGQRISIEPQNRIPGARTDELGKNDFSLLELLRWMILVKDGSATNTIIDLVGMDRVMKLCADLGLAQTVLQRKMHDLDARRQGIENLTSAADMGKLLHLVHKQSLPNEDESLLSSFVSRQTIALMRECRDGMGIMRHIPWTMSCAHQSGQLEAMGDYPAVTHDMGIVDATGGTYTLAIFVQDPESVTAGERLIGEIGRDVYQQVLYTP